MLTILLQMTVKPGREAECAKVAAELTASTLAEDNGCISYTYYRRSDEPRHLLLFEQWADQDSLNAHISRLQRVLGPPDDQEPYPPAHHRRRLPKAFLALFEHTEVARYDPIV
jgi:quinol monooxygenase YgiN